MRRKLLAGADRQVGFGVLAYLLAAAAVVAGLSALYAVVDGRGYARGKSEIETAFARRDNEALRKAIEARAAAEQRVREIEAERSAAVSLAATEFERGKADAQKTVAAAVARVRAGDRLRDPGRAGCSAASPAGPVSAAKPGAGGGDGRAQARLPEPAVGILSADASEFLVRLAGEADDVARQLAACQRIVEAGRR